MKIALIEVNFSQCFDFDFGDCFVLRLRDRGKWNDRFRLSLLGGDGGKRSFRIDGAKIRHVKASRDNGIRTSRYDNPCGDSSHWQCRSAQHVVLSCISLLGSCI